MKKTALFMLLVSFVLVSCNANGQGEQVNKKETIKESNTNLKTKSKMKTIHLTKEEFLTKVANFETSPNEWKYLGDKPAIIDFYAEWCGPCKSIAPVLEELAAEYEGEIYIYKIDTEAEQELASAFGIRSIPSLLFVPMDEAPQMAQGAMPKSAFKEAIESVLLKKK
ncbi:MAG: thioredoxin [Tannerellaceae bacterium]|jgi:thioredoxin|nr:thioredoxin [Tannerellaceae bacterium]MBP8758999.1 thioredoxin [Parabacteroides sp.]MBP9480930.1 thioredoxin [Parabacteroides sp.]MBP9579855.1 thioredoxin [Parabacteroides sp.]MDD3359892.1 thioredoxin [Parabacteroides sp.]